MVKNIAGNDFEVVLLLPPGSSPHTFDPNPSDVKKTLGTQQIFAIGHGIDNWVGKMVDSDQKQRIIIVDMGIQLLTSGEKDEDVDPHYWLTVPNAMLISKNVADNLTANYPNLAASINYNHNEYEKKLAKLDYELRKNLNQLGNRNIAVYHSAWNYFANEYGLKVVASYEEFAGKTPTPPQLADFMKKIKTAQVTTIFSEPEFSQMELEAVANDLQVKVSILDPEGGVPGRDSYISMMQFNVQRIIDANSN
jgi:zinc transport system substrate-binding protein